MTLKTGDLKSTTILARKPEPNLVLIEGGTFTMGTSEEDVTQEHNNLGAGLPLTHSIWIRRKYPTLTTANTSTG